LKSIEGNASLSEHVALVQDSLNLIFDFTTLHKASSDDELTVQLLGIRLFNACVSSLKLGLGGYYQTAFNVHRDLVETSFLLDFFTIDRARIEVWRKSTRQERLKNFSPRVIREGLNSRDGNAGKTKRDAVYEALCELGTHPTYGGAKLIAPQRLARIGPFFDAELLELLINELALRLPHAVLFYVLLFGSVDPGLVKAMAAHADKVRLWAKKYVNKNIELGELDQPGGGTEQSTNAK
jgi:hypothetical protein